MKRVDIVDGAIRRVPDFPKKGILFYDVTGIFTNPAAFSAALAFYKECADQWQPQVIAAVEARGFLFAAGLARELELPLVLLRKKGKLPGRTLAKTYDLEYGTATLELHADDVPKNARVMIVDDLAATGGTLKAGAELIKEAGGTVCGIAAVVGLEFLPYRQVLHAYKVGTLCNYDHE